jgi:eukaryotic-like serine/threonine-protein kinase
MRTRLCSFAIALGLAISGVACASGGGAGGKASSTSSPSDNVSYEEFASYSDSKYGFTLQYPKDWEKQVGAMGSAVVILSPREGDSDKFRENVNVLVQTLPDKMTLDQYSKLSLDQAPKLITGFDLLDQGPTQLAGRPARRVHYRGEQGSFRLEWEQVWTVLGGQAFILTYTAERDRYEMYLRTAEATFASFRLV